MKSNHKLRSVFLLLILALTACQPANSGPAATSTPPPVLIESSTKAPPTALPSPTPLALEYPIPEWNRVELKNVCIQLDELYDSQNPSSNTESHRNRVVKLLHELKFNTSSTSGDCDATLSIAAGFFDDSSTYSVQDTGSSFECVTGQSFHGLMVLTVTQLPPLYTTISNNTGNAPYVTFGGCPDQSILFDTAWTQSILEGLSHLLGPSVIIAMYKSKDDIHRNAAFGASQALGPDDLAVLPDVIEAISKNTNIDSRAQIANGIQNMGNQAQEAASVIVPSLLDELKTSDVDPFMPGLLDQTIVETLGKLGPGSKDAVPVLLEMLDDPNSPVAAGAILQTLGNIGPAAEASIPVLLQKAQEDEAYAVEAIGKLGVVNPEILSVLMEMAGNHKQDFWMSAVAMEALASLQSQSPEILPFLLSATQDTDPVFAETAIRCLGLSGTNSPEVYQLLKKSISQPKDSLQTTAIDALKTLSPGFGPQVRETVPALLAIAQKRDQFSRAPDSAIDALSVIEKDSPEVIAVFNNILTSTHVLSDFALDQMGPESRELVPALIEALEANQIGGPQDIATLTSYLHALISITGEYPGYRAQDWQAWQQTQ
jgi:HEAT repeat protein